MVSADAGEQELRDAKVVVVSIPACPYCKRAKEGLKMAGVTFTDVDVHLYADVRKEVKALVGSQTVPQVFVNGASVGGADALLALLASGAFQQQVSAASAPALPAALVDVVQQARVREAAEAATRPASSARQAPDSQLLALGERLRNASSGVPTTQTQIGQLPYRTFTAQQLLSWLADKQSLPAAGTRATAQQLLEARIIAVAPTSKAPPSQAQASFILGDAPRSASASGEVLYCATADAPKPLSGQPLNTQVWWYGPARPATEVAGELRGLILQLYDKYLSKDGRAVSYKGIAADPLFVQYVAATAELQQVDLAPLPVPERKALFINLYNALIVHALVTHGTRMSSAQRAVFYSKVAKYNIGGAEYSADDMENGVLRGNRAAASNLWNVLGLHGMAGQHMHGDDSRKAHVVPCDPRIHFALVCGAKSCPPIKLYTPENVDEGLQAAAEAFVTDDVTVDVAARRVSLSKIFKWYAPDFGSNKRELLQFLLPYLPPRARADLQGLLDSGADISVSHKAYDWGVNDDE